MLEKSHNNIVDRWTTGMVAFFFVLVDARSVVEILAGPRRTPVFSVPVVAEDGRDVGTLAIEDGDEPADAVAAFCREHGLPTWFRKTMVDSVCASKTCGRKRGLVFEAPIAAPSGMELPITLQVWDDEDPIRAMEKYLTEAELLVKRNRSAWERTHKALTKEHTKFLDGAKSLEGSARARPKRDSALAKAAVVAAKIEDHAKTEPPNFVVEAWFRNALVDHVCGLRGVQCERPQALPELPVVLQDRGLVGAIRAYEGDEAIDHVYKFARDHDLDNDVFKNSLLEYVCQREPRLSCERKRALAYARSISDLLGNPHLSHWPDFEVWEDEEVVDVAYKYVRRFALDEEAQATLITAACAAIPCKRGDAIVFRFPVHEAGESKGDIELYEDQRPADAVYDFCKREKYLQPKYTDMGIRATLHRDFCRAYNDSHIAAYGRPMDDVDEASCVAGPANAREPLFLVEFTVWDLDHKLRFYDDDFPPTCPEANATFSAQAWNKTPASSTLLKTDDTSSCDERRHAHAAAALCGRVVPAAPGCEAALEPNIAMLLARTERKRYEMASPFGYDYYLPLRELRDAPNTTLQAAYLRALAPLPAILVDAKANVSSANRSVETALLPTGHAARRSLAAARGQRSVLMTTLDAALEDLDSLRAQIAEPLTVVDEGRVDQRLATLAVQLAATSRLLDGLFDDLDRSRALVDEHAALLNLTTALFNDTRPQVAALETKSRVLKEARAVFADRKRRETHDKPCKKIFGACCAKDTDDGGKDIKCGGDFENA